MLKIYNTLSQKKEEFKPIQAGKIGIYVCGNTVYDYCHIGHGRTMVTFDMITRYLRARGYEVNYVRNITDIDDKIIKRANENNESIDALTERFINAQHEDERALNILPPDHEPRATHNIDGMIKMIEQLIKNNYAYVASNNDVYYNVQAFKNYGALAHRDLNKLRSGARVEITEEKKDPLDFVLWKSAKPGEPQWNSPWGPGRPGWHIECSVMSTKCLGQHFDIHGGGFDLIFPHHENEIAQTEGTTQEKFVNTWMHSGFLQIDKEKMSKSLGNFITIKEALKKYHSEILRYFFLSGHYRSQLNYSDEGFVNARQALERFYMALKDLPVVEAIENNIYDQRFYEAMDDDFNTPEALATLFDLTREINKIKNHDPEKAAGYAGLLRKLANNILGILHIDPAEFLKNLNGQSNLSEAEIEKLIQARNLARTQKNWAEADRVRAELIKHHIILEDNEAGTSWRVEVK